MNRRKAVGFDRPIELPWLDAVAAKVAEGAPPPDVRKYLYSVLEGAVAGSTKNSARGKTVTVLSHIWCLVPDHAVPLRDRAARLLGTATPDERLAIHWAMMIATYPFFTDVTSALGKLLSLHGTVALSQLKRRMVETWGERSTIEKAIPRLLRSMARWGALRGRSQEGDYLPAGGKRLLGNPVALLLLEALLVDSDQVSMELEQLVNHSSLFPFQMGIGPQDLRGADEFVVHQQGVDQLVVSPRSSGRGM